MNEIVNQVFETEAQARKLLDETRAEIQTLQQNTDKDIEEINIRAREHAGAALKKIIEETRRQVDEDQKKSLLETEQKDQDFFLDKNEKISEVINGIVDFISTPEYLRDK